MEGLELRIDIDPYKLDEEWIAQPRQFLKWSEKLADARLEYDRIKAHLDVVKAELDQAIREDPIAYGLNKVTETAVQNTVLTQSEHKQAIENLNKSRYEMGMIQAAVEALEQRRKALENLVSLHGMQYFSEPKAPAARKEEVANAEKKKLRTAWLNKSDE